MTTGAALRVAAIVVALLATTLLTHYVRGGKAIYFFEPHHIVWLFGASNTAFLVAMLLQLYRVARDGAAGVSLPANALNLAAVAVRGVFVGGGRFGSSAFARGERRSAARRSRSCSRFPTTAAPRAVGRAAARRARRASDRGARGELRRLGRRRVAALDERRHLFRWICLAVWVCLEAGAVLPQRALLHCGRSGCPRSPRTLFLWALSGALRLLRVICLRASSTCS